MKALKKSVSVLLALLIVAAGMTVGFSVSAAETYGTVTATSTVGESVTAAFTETTEQVTVTYKLQADKYLVNTQAYVTYDPAVLSIPESEKTNDAVPVLKYSGAKVNFGESGIIKFNATDLSLIDFTEEDIYFTLTFDVIGSGDTTVALNIDVLTATKATESSQAVSANDIYLIRYGVINTDENYSVTAALECTEPVPPSYYLVGSMNDWQTDEAYLFTANSESETEEYVLANVALTTESQFKVIGTDGSTTTWYPDGMGNNYGENGEITANGTYTIYFRPNYDGGDGWFAGTILAIADEIPTEPATEEPTTEESTTEPVAPEYYLFGYINGANYACEEDSANIGTYQFADGSLTATFTQDSYVAVKTGDNLNWYMTNGWLGTEVTSATLYNTNTLGDNANKLYVPGGVEVTFTLVDNVDDTLTLSYTAAEEPTTAEPTTEEPTTEPVVENTDVYVVADSFNLKLTTVGVNKVGGEIALPAGTYTLKMQKYGTMMGYNKTVTDSSNGLTFNEKYQASTTLIATGGVYFFQFSTDTNALVIKHTGNEVPNAYLIGDAHTILKPVDGKTLAIGSTYLEPGTYDFKLNIGGTEYGYNKTVTNTTNGATLNTRSTYKANISLVATGGTYTFTLNTATNGLIISYIAAKDEAKNDVHITGDFNLVLDDNGGNDDIATGTITLEDNAYSIQVMNYGTIYTLGEKLLENKTKKLSPSYKAPLTFIANGGTYTFTFDKTTGSLTVTKA